MASMENMAEQVIKTDAVGRMITPAERRESLLDEFERSGLSGVKFAAVAGIKYPTFASWVHQRRRRRGMNVKTPTDVGSQMRWLETVIEQAQNPAAKDGSVLTLQLPGGASVRIGELGQVALAAA